LVPSAWHHVERYANNRIEADHGQLKHRLRPMRGLHTDHSAQTIITGHAFMQNLRRCHYELGVDAPRGLRIAAAFTELAAAIGDRPRCSTRPPIGIRNSAILNGGTTRSNPPRAGGSEP
jgi:hypothetical protein